MIKFCSAYNCTNRVEKGDITFYLMDRCDSPPCTPLAIKLGNSCEHYLLFFVLMQIVPLLHAMASFLVVSNISMTATRVAFILYIIRHKTNDKVVTGHMKNFNCCGNNPTALVPHPNTILSKRTMLNFRDRSFRMIFTVLNRYKKRLGAIRWSRTVLSSSRLGHQWTVAEGVYFF